jgi:hypothetical protein
MAIDYVLAMGCGPHERLGVDRLVGLHRTRIMARAALAHLRAEGDRRAPAEIELQVATGTGPAASGRRAGMTLQAMLDESAALDDVTPLCAACPAGLPRELACHRRIRYPIPEHVEAWLIGRLPATLACTAGTLLARGLAELAWSGEPAARLRASGSSYFESRAPYGMRWNREGGALEVSSDQLFHMMFFVGNLAPSHCLMLAVFCGVVPHDISPAELRDEAARTRALAAAELAPHPDPDIEQIAQFLRMLAVAARLDVPIFIDG